MMRIVMVLSFTLLLSGCSGKGQVLKEDADTFSILLEETMIVTRDFYARLGKVKLDLFVHFMATRVHCDPDAQVFIIRSQNRCLSDNEIKKRLACKKSVRAHSNCKVLLSAKSFEVAKNFMQPRQSLVTLIGVLVSYQDILSKLLVDKKYDSKKQLEKLSDKLLGLRKKLSKYREKKLTKIDEEALTAKLTAIGNFADLVRSINRNKRIVSNIREVLKKQAPLIEQSFQSLLSRYVKRDRPILNGIIRQKTTRARGRYRRLSSQQRKSLLYDRRRQMISEIYEGDWIRLEQSSQPDVLAVSLQVLVVSHQKLVNAFNGNLTNEQKKRAAKINRRYLVSIIRSMSKIVKAF
ncbi:hypothetical protein MNBD_GAMMA12-2189 [hydrothermal vent metagenome]|uniref:Lipoprotein n=1 Tax=hydrothermal vent metagenome TaxID=652676 RepID=A0A3B0XYR7_9ZZZZ